MLTGKSVGILETIKLFLDSEGCVFVVGTNKGIIDGWMKSKYKDTILDGSDYLDKIIQVSINIPNLRQDDTIEFIEKIAPENIKDYKIIIANVGGNPRKIKRIINKFILQITLAESNPKLKGIINYPVVAKLLVLEHRWSEFYNDLIRSYEKKTKGSRTLKVIQNLSDEKD